MDTFNDTANNNWVNHMRAVTKLMNPGESTSFVVFTERMQRVRSRVSRTYRHRPNYVSASCTKLSDTELKVTLHRRK